MHILQYFHSQDCATHDTIQLSTDSHCPTLAKETLVSKSPKIESRFFEKASSQISSTSANIKHYSSKSSSIQSHCMALIDKYFKGKGLSRQTRKLLQASWRKGTQNKNFSCKFRKFNSWCSRREIYPYNSSLTELFTEGLYYRTCLSQINAIFRYITNSNISCGTTSLYPKPN